MTTISPALFSSAPDLAEIATRLAPDGRLTMPALADAYTAARAARSLSQQDAIRKMINMVRAATPREINTVIDVRAAQANLKTEGQLLSEQLGERLDNLVIGQEVAKKALCRAVRANPPGGATKPTPIVLTGPSGVGKSEMAFGLARSLHPDLPGVEPIVINGSMFKNPSDLAILQGAPPGYVGYNETNAVAPLSEENIAKKFCGKKPIVLLIDEIDDIDPSVRSDFWSTMNTALDKGYFELKNGKRISLDGAYIIITSNAGLKTVGSLRGEAAAEHFRKSLKDAIPEQKILNRIGRGNIVPCDRLTEDDLREITRTRFLQPLQESALADVRNRRGADMELGFSDIALKLITSLGLSDEVGARTARDIVDKLISPLVRESLQRARDGDTVRLDVKPEFTDADRAMLRARFEALDGLPPELEIDSSPWCATLQSSARVFTPYAGEIPVSPVDQPIIHATGVLAGDGYMLYNRGEPDSPNELIQLVDGSTQGKDRVRHIALPPQIAQANLSLNATELSPTELLITSVNIPLAATDPEISAVIYDHTSKTSKTIAPPPLALSGATLRAAGDGALLVGGRPVYFDGEYWSVAIQTDEITHASNPNDGISSQDQAWFYDRKSDHWRALDSQPQSARSGMASIALGKEIVLLGGEETRTRPNGTTYSRASSAVDIFDSETGKFTVRAPLPTDIAYATAVVNHEHRAIDLLGGVSFTWDPAQQMTRAASRSTIISLPLSPTGDSLSESLRIRVRANALPGEIVMSAAIPRGPSYVTGPFVDELNLPYFAVMA